MKRIIVNSYLSECRFYKFIFYLCPGDIARTKILKIMTKNLIVCFSVELEDLPGLIKHVLSVHEMDSSAVVKNLFTTEFLNVKENLVFDHD